MEGCGNDYVYVDGSKEIIHMDKKPDIVRKLSDRHFGIGSDGVIFINKIKDGNADFEMEMWNADGTRSEMCGNGIRCVAKFVYDKGLTDKTSLVITSFGKPKYIDLTLNNNKVSMVKVNMGAPILTPSEIPVKLPEASAMESDNVISYPISVLGKEYKTTCVSMGNPHSVVFLDDNIDLSTFELEKIGPEFENHEYFPNRINAEFVHIDNRQNVHMRVWERGTGETLACGTGCCATAVACILNGLTDNKITIHVLGGDIVCEWDREKNVIFMTGPATTVFEGDIDI